MRLGDSDVGIDICERIEAAVPEGVVEKSLLTLQTGRGDADNVKNRYVLAVRSGNAVHGACKNQGTGQNSVRSAETAADLLSSPTPTAEGKMSDSEQSKTTSQLTGSHQDT